jgi:hypothetical protein
MSLRVSLHESTQRRKVELWARNVREFCLNADLQITFRDLLHAVKLRHGTDGFTSPPKEGVLRIFSALKIRRLRPGVNMAQGYCLITYRGSRGSIQGQFLWDLWRSEWHWDRPLFQYFGSPLSIHFHVCSILICHTQYINIAVVSVVK